MYLSGTQVFSTVISRDKDSTPECCGHVPFGSPAEPSPTHPAQALCPAPGMFPGCKYTVVILDFFERLDFIQTKCARPDPDLWIWSPQQIKHLVLFVWLSPQLFLPCKNRLFDCQLKKHFWLLKGILKVIPCLGETHENISFFPWGFMPYSEGRRLTQRLL